MSMHPHPLRRGSSVAVGTSSSSKPPFRSKFSVSYEALLAGEHPWLYTPGSASGFDGTPSGSSSASNIGGGSSYFSASSGKKPSAPRARFFADLLCLKVEPKSVETLLDAVSARQLTDDDEGSKGARIRDNVGSLWRECLRVWTDVPERSEPDSSSASASVNTSDESRRTNAIDTLTELSRSILAKKFTHSSSSLDLIWIFAGGIDEADDVFEELVNAIDAGLRGNLDSVTQRRRASRSSRASAITEQGTVVSDELPTLQGLLSHRIGAVHLAIVWISHAFTTNLSAYFCRQDLFVGACSLLASIQSIMRTSCQPGRLPLADEDEELLRVVVRDTMLLIGLLAGLGQGSTSGTGVGMSFKAIEASSNPYFRRMCDWVDGGSMHLLRDALSVDMETAWRAFEVQEVAVQEGFLPSMTGGLTASLGAFTEGLRKMTTFSAAPEDPVSADLPPPLTSCLLSVYLMCRANQLFVEVVMKEATPPTKVDGEEEPSDVKERASFAAAMISLFSYLATHGSLNERSRAYSRLALLIPLTLLTNSAGITALAATDRPNDVAAIRLCSQRSGPLSMRSLNTAEQGASLTMLVSQLTSLGSTQGASVKRTRMLPFVLDTCVQYMRHNLRKRLDTSGYLICLQVLLLSIRTCADRRIQLAYSEWPDVWGTLSSTIVFLVGRHVELRGVEIGKLGQALLSLLSLALLESDRFLPTRRDTDVLIYELVRSNEAIRRLAHIVALGKDPPERTGAPAESRANKASQRAIAAALPMWRLIDLTLSSFDERLNEWSEKRSGRNLFGLPSFSALTASYFGGAAASTDVDAGAEAGSDKGFHPASGTVSPNGTGSSTPTAPSRRIPDVRTVLTLISGLDMEQIVQKFDLESEGGGGGGGSGAGAAPSARLRSVTSRKGAVIDEEWLERAESQSLAEAFRFAADDMRTLIAPTG